ncbi:MAG: hypothetical protein J6J18_12400 [Oscillospiraceae bacterium]|nr:hypothetical protein [Oscillospiraceae bacterium]
MYMGQFRFKCWCSDAVSGIIFPPDQRKVYDELYQHLEDHYDALVEQGMDKEDAVKAALAAMGDAWEIAPQLAAIHRPFWGYFLRVTRILLVIFLIATIIPFGKFLYNTTYQEPVTWAFDIFDPDAYEEKGYTLVRCLKPDVTVRSDGYTFTVTDAVEWQYPYPDSATGTTDYLCLRMTEFHPLPWVEHTDVGLWLWAEDSLGNIYGCTKENTSYSEEEEEYLCARGSQVGPFLYAYTLWINYFDIQNAEWITIHYDRDGRDLTWHIDLTGGDTP